MGVAGYDVFTGWSHGGFTSICELVLHNKINITHKLSLHVYESEQPKTQATAHIIPRIYETSFITSFSICHIYLCHVSSHSCG